MRSNGPVVIPSETEGDYCREKGFKRYFACLFSGQDLPAYSSGKYDWIDVINLWRGLRRFDKRAHLTILTDDEMMLQASKSSQEMRTKHEAETAMETTCIEKFAEQHVGGWTPRLEVFSPKFAEDLAPGERAVLLDLDSVIVGNIDWLHEWDEAPIGAPPDPLFPAKVCSTVITFDRQGAEIIWKAYGETKRTGNWPYLIGGRPSEMELLRKIHNDHGWPTLDGPQKRLKSWKVSNVQQLGIVPPNTSIVYFHGNPKVREIPRDHPVREAWSA